MHWEDFTEFCRNYVPKEYWYVLIGLLVVVIIYNIIRIIIRAYQEGQKRKTIQLARDCGYFDSRSKAMLTAFGDCEAYPSLRMSSTIVNNFSSDKYMDYLVKYFHLEVNTDTLLALRNLEKGTSKVNAKAEEENVNAKYVERLYPTLTMVYVSPQGRSSLESSVVLDCETIQEICGKIENMMEKKNHAKTQRSKMTPELREFIMKRDNYTCQICGNSKYREPNLLLEVDHIHPVSAGGTTTFDNLWTLCWKCNRSKSNHIM